MLLSIPLVHGGGAKSLAACIGTVARGVTTETVAEAVVAALVGSIGLILAVPATTAPKLPAADRRSRPLYE